MDFEKLGAFYLGKEYDLESQQLTERLMMYDARDLTTHAVCVGMTGSGKTGLCIDLLEEAAIDQIPAIILDPKGDITNLLLQFPELRPEDFQPWVNEEDARRKGLGVAEYAAGEAEKWRNGLSQWGLDGSRIQMLKDAAEYTIFTPGSETGVPVSILQAFSAPRLDWDLESEALRDRIQGTVGALLGLVGLESDPVKSREHILLANLLEFFWRQHEDLDLPKLIWSIQNPPIQRLGVFEVDTFFPQKDRFELAMSLNNIIASPSFASWLKGQPLDISGFLATAEGKPRHSIFYIAHLSEAERIFFVAMLLNEVVGWMRTQPGTTSLRALVYMDEIFGFFPPVAEPPSKKPLLTLLKQARAFGVGLLLATQNPADLDYKGLTNAGTWLIGRLQTERDKKRILDGLEGGSGAGSSREKLSGLISDLGNRVFLMHNVHDEAPVAFQTRWAMSYLRGPLTRIQIRDLMSGRKDKEQTDRALSELAAASTVEGQSKELPRSEESAITGYSAIPPTLSPKIQQVYFSVTKGLSSALYALESQEGHPIQKLEHLLLYKPAIFGGGRVHFVDRRRKVDESREFALLAPVPSRLEPVRWDQARPVAAEGSSPLYHSQPEPDASFDRLPDSVNEASEIAVLGKDLQDHLYRTSSLDLFYSSALKEYSRPGEAERDFRLRLTQVAREARDDEVEKLEQRYESRLRRTSDKLRTAQLALEKKQSTATARNREFLVSMGESLVGMFLGRKSMRSASSSLGKYRMKSSATQAIEEAEEKMEALEREVAALQDELKDQAEAIARQWEQSLESFEVIPITPRQADIEVDTLVVAWEPFWLVHFADSRGIEKTQSVPAGSI